jgi:hypothetical protein
MKIKSKRATLYIPTIITVSGVSAVKNLRAFPSKNVMRILLYYIMCGIKKKYVCNIVHVNYTFINLAPNNNF